MLRMLTAQQKQLELEIHQVQQSILILSRKSDKMQHTYMINRDPDLGQEIRLIMREIENLTYKRTRLEVDVQQIKALSNSRLHYT